MLTCFTPALVYKLKGVVGVVPSSPKPSLLGAADGAAQPQPVSGWPLDSTMTDASDGLGALFGGAFGPVLLQNTSKLVTELSSVSLPVFE